MAIHEPRTDIVLPARLHDVLSELGDSSPFVDPAPVRGRRSPSTWLVISLALIVGAGALYAAVSIAVDPEPGGLAFPLIFGPLAILRLAGVVIASFRALGPFVTLPFLYLGMLLVGRTVGRRAEILVVGPWLFRRQAGRLVRERHRSVRLEATGLLVFDPGPLDLDASTDKVNLGALVGALLNILITGPIAIAATWLWLGGPQPLSYLLIFTAMLLAANFALAAVVFIAAALRALGGSQDQPNVGPGTILGETAARWGAGVRPRDMEDLADRMAGLADAPQTGAVERYLLNSQLHLIALDSGDLERARSRLFAALRDLESVPDKQRHAHLGSALTEIYDEAAYFSAIHLRDTSGAASWLARADADALATYGWPAKRRCSMPPGIWRRRERAPRAASSCVRTAARWANARRSPSGRRH